MWFEWEVVGRETRSAPAGVPDAHPSACPSTPSVAPHDPTPALWLVGGGGGCRRRGYRTTAREWRDRHARHSASSACSTALSWGCTTARTWLGEPAEAEIWHCVGSAVRPWWSPGRLGRPVATVGVVRRRCGLGRLKALHLKALDPKATVTRCQRERPGELIHIEARSSRRAHRRAGSMASAITSPATAAPRNAAVACSCCTSAVMTLPGSPTPTPAGERTGSAVAFLSVLWLASPRWAVTVERVMTDNGSA